MAGHRARQSFFRQRPLPRKASRYSGRTPAGVWSGDASERATPDQKCPPLTGKSRSAGRNYRAAVLCGETAWATAGHTPTGHENLLQYSRAGCCRFERKTFRSCQIQMLAGRIPAGGAALCARYVPRRDVGLVRAAAGAAGTAAAAGRGQRHFRINREAHIGKVDVHALDLRQQILGNAEGKTFGFQLFVIILRLIQSQCQTGAASAAGCEKDADGLLVLIRKIGLKLLAGAGGKIQHGGSVPCVFFRVMRVCVVSAGGYFPRECSCDVHRPVMTVSTGRNRRRRHIFPSCKVPPPACQ